MRFVAVVVFCLVGSVASGFAQSVSQTVATPRAAAAAPPTTQPVVQPLDKQAATSPAQPAAPPIAQSAKTPVQPAARPIEQTAKPAAPPATQQFAKPVEQPSKQPVAQAAKPTEQTGIRPAELQTEKPAEPSVEQLAAKTTVPAEEQPGVKPAEQPVTSTTVAATEPTCPGHPNAIGTSRVITISPSEYRLLGTIQYKRTLPLKDHEVVLTFDDGPIPPYTNSILDTLAANCVKATYFLVGTMAHARPYLVRRIYNEGHSIGTHTQHHPFAMQRLSMQRVKSEVEGGIASIDGALGDPKAVSPFFRIPGLGRTNAIEHYLENKGLVTWSADVDTNDWWRGTTPGALIQRTMRRLNAKGRGILLMHDIHPATALALPTLLKRLKEAGYHIVHVVAAGERPKSLPEVVATPAEKAIWPRVAHASAKKSGPATTSLRHRVKKVIRHRHRHNSARHKRAAKSNYANTAMNEDHDF